MGNQIEKTENEMITEPKPSTLYAMSDVQPEWVFCG